jgi:hypothetical protein
MRSVLSLLLAVSVAACFGGGLGPPQGSLVGTWGGDDAGFIVTDTSAHAHVGCTKGDVHARILTDEFGRFDVLGEYNVNAYPVDLGILHPARFIGQVTGAQMTLTIVLTDTTLSFGPVSLRYGRAPEMAMCPICR